MDVLHHLAYIELTSNYHHFIGLLQHFVNRKGERNTCNYHHFIGLLQHRHSIKDLLVSCNYHHLIGLLQRLIF